MWASLKIPVVKNSPAIAGDAGDPDLIPGSGTDRGVWWVIVHVIVESDTTEHACT